MCCLSRPRNPKWSGLISSCQLAGHDYSDLCILMPACQYNPLHITFTSDGIPNEQVRFGDRYLFYISVSYAVNMGYARLVSESRECLTALLGLYRRTCNLCMFIFQASSSCVFHPVSIDGMNISSPFILSNFQFLGKTTHRPNIYVLSSFHPHHRSHVFMPSLDHVMDQGRQ